jgi:hypothetical protein
MSNKKWHFSWVMVHPFYKESGVLKNSATFFYSELEDDRNTWCLCRHTFQDKVVNLKSEIRPFIHLTKGEILPIHNIQVKTEQQKRKLSCYAQV